MAQARIVELDDNGAERANHGWYEFVELPHVGDDIHITDRRETRTLRVLRIVHWPASAEVTGLLRGAGRTSQSSATVYVMLVGPNR